MEGPPGFAGAVGAVGTPPGVGFVTGGGVVGVSDVGTVVLAPATAKFACPPLSRFSMTVVSMDMEIMAAIIDVINTMAPSERLFSPVMAYFRDAGKHPAAT